MHVVMLLTAATVPLPGSAECSPHVLDLQGFVEVFNKDVKLVIPGALSWTEDDWH